MTGIFVTALFLASGCTSRLADDGLDGETAAKLATPSDSKSIRPEKSPKDDLGIEHDDFAQAAAGLDKSTIVDADELLTRNNRTQHRYHRVEANDTLSKICIASGCELADLLRLNGLKQDDVIRPGQLIYLPRRPSSLAR